MRIAFIFALIFPFSSLLAQEGGLEANRKLRATVQQWIAVMKEIQERKEDWQEQKRILLDSKVALESETAQLKSEIAAAEERKQKLDTESRDKIEKKETYDAARAALRAGLNDLEAKVSAVIPLLPRELASEDKVQQAIADHQKFAKQEDKDELDLNGRLTPMVTILVEAEKFNQIVTPFEGRSVTVGNEEVLLDGIYFGLAMGFAADETGRKAIQLKVGPEGWTESEITDSETVSLVRDLIDVGTGAGQIRLIDLPLEIAQ